MHGQHDTNWTSSPSPSIRSWGPMTPSAPGGGSGIRSSGRRIVPRGTRTAGSVTRPRCW